MSNVAIRGIGQFLMKVEGVAFATDPGTWTSGLRVPCTTTPDLSGATRLKWDDESIRTTLAEIPMIVAATGQTDFELSFDVNLPGHLATVPVGIAAAHWAAILVGGIGSIDIGPAVPDTANNTVSVLTGKAGNDFDGVYAGSMVTIDALPGAGNTWEARYVTAVDETAAATFGTATVPNIADHPFTGIPDDDSVLYTGLNCHTNVDGSYGDGAGGVQDSIAFLWTGLSAEDEVLLLGCRLSGLVITYTTGAIPTASFTFKVAAAIPQANHGYIVDIPVAGATATPVVDGTCWLHTQAEPGVDLPLAASEVVATFEMEVVAEQDVNATYGIADWTRTSQKVTVAIDPLFDDQLETWSLAQTPLHYEQTFGPQPGKMMGLSLGSCYLVAENSAEREELVTRPIVLSAGRNEVDVHTENGAIGLFDEEEERDEAYCYRKSAVVSFG